jgi:hypothetical protein
MTATRASLVLALVVCVIWATPTGRAQTRPLPPVASHGSFEKDVRPILEDVCSRCHNEKKPTAGLNIALFTDPATLQTRRDDWEFILAKLMAGDMPPAGEDQPSDEAMAALIAYVQSAFDAADRTAKPDPGRVTARRLNRAEYANTIRDLLGVDFRVSDEFPPDDTGYGFDNIGDVLTVSPTLMEKYLGAAERISARAIGGDPLPNAGFFTRRDRVRRVGDGVIELRQVVDYDAEYLVRVGVAGHRGADDPPVTLAISVDGTPVKTVSVPVQINAVNKQGGSTQRSVFEARTFLPTNEHVFRAAFVDDEGLKNIPAKSRTDTNQNIFPEYVEVAGPYRPAEPHPVQKKILVCNPASGAVCVNRILSTVARRAYRRPVTPAEVAQLVAVFDKARASKYSPSQSLQFALTAVLVSPKFLFRIEHDPAPAAHGRITDLELASRLSYFLWSSMPDERLLTLASTARLHQPPVLSAEVQRMLADPKAAALSENFAGQWLETRGLDSITRDTQKFPEWTPELRDAMKTETRLFFDAVVRDNRPVSDFINGKYTFLNELLARHYGIAGVAGPEFRRVELSTDQRSGVFTQASVLTVSSYPTRTSVVLRGKYLLDNVLNAPPPPPPPDVPPLDDAKVGVAQSLRAQMEQHRADPFCASCHTKMDPLGFGLENYDAVGKWRTEDGKFPVDASGWFPNGQKFSSPEAMKTILLGAMPDFTRSLAEKMLTYALGRGLEMYDRPTIRALEQTTEKEGYRIQTLIQGIVKSAPFDQRRAERTPIVTEAARK